MAQLWLSGIGRTETDKASSAARAQKCSSTCLDRAFSESCFGSCIRFTSLHFFVTNHTRLRHKLPGKPHVLCGVSSRLGPLDSRADALSSGWCRGRARDLIGLHTFCGNFLGTCMSPSLSTWSVETRWIRTGFLSVKSMPDTPWQGQSIFGWHT